MDLGKSEDETRFRKYEERGSLGIWRKTNVINYGQMDFLVYSSFVKRTQKGETLCQDFCEGSNKLFYISEVMVNKGGTQWSNCAKLTQNILCKTIKTFEGFWRKV